MANKNYSQLTAISRALAPADLIPMWGDSEAATRKVTAKELGIAKVFAASAGTASENTTAIQAMVTAAGAIRFAGATTYQINDEISIPSDTSIDLGDCTIEQTGSAKNIFINSDSAAGNSNISVRGGILDCGTTDANNIGGGGAVVVGSRAINFDNATELSVDNIYIKNCSGHGIDLTDCKGFAVTRCVIENFGDDGISLVGTTTGQKTHAGVIANNRIYGKVENASYAGAQSGIEIEDGTNQVSVIGNYIEGLTETGTSGIHIVNDAAGVGTCSKITIVGNVIENCSGRGISAINNDTSGNFHSEISIVANSATNIGSYGFGFSRTKRGTISNNVVSGAGSDGINAGNSDKITFAGNSIFNVDGHGFSMYQSDDCIIDGNIIIDTGSASGNQYGVLLNGCSGVMVSDNKIANDAGTYTYGIRTYSSSDDGSVITGNDVENVTTNGAKKILAAAGASIVANNRGVIRSTVTLTVGASPYTYTSGPGEETVYIRGGTVSEIKINNQVIASSSDVTVVLPPREDVKVTYSSAPTMKTDAQYI